METKIETLKKPNGDQVLPRTRAKAVSMEDGTTVEAAIGDINETLNDLSKSIENFTLTDTSTGTKYKLSVTGGKLNLVTVTE